MNKLNTPLVSIIIPAYNAEKHVKACIESVLGQTYENIEVIIVDDGSSDNTYNVAKEFETDTIKVILQPNMGGCVARNTGIKNSSGKYLQFLDADDFISPDKIEKQVEILEKDLLKISVCPTVHFYDGENPIIKSIPDESFYLQDTDDIADFFSRLWGADGQMHMVQTSAWLVPRQLIDQAGMWNEDILLDQDGEFFARIAMNSKGVRVSEGINYYRKYIHGNNVAGKYKKAKNLDSAFESSKLKTDYLLKTRNDSRSRKAVANIFMQLAIDAYPQYPEIYNKVMLEVRKQNEKPVIPILGGRIIEMIKKVMGWKMAKRISYEFHKIQQFQSQTK